MIINDIIVYMKDIFFTLVEVSEQLRVSKLTIWRYIKAGKLPAYKFGRDLRIKEADLDKFIDSRLQPIKEKS